MGQSETYAFHPDLLALTELLRCCDGHVTDGFWWTQTCRGQYPLWHSLDWGIRASVTDSNSLKAIGLGVGNPRLPTVLTPHTASIQT